MITKKNNLGATEDVRESINEAVSDVEVRANEARFNLQTLEQGALMGNVEVDEGASINGLRTSDTGRLALDLMAGEESEKKKKERQAELIRKLDQLQRHIDQMRADLADMRKRYAELEAQEQRHLENITLIQELMKKGNDGEYDAAELAIISDSLGIEIPVGTSKAEVDKILKSKEVDEATKLEATQEEMNELSEKMREKELDIQEAEQRYENAKSAKERGNDLEAELALVDGDDGKAAWDNEAREESVKENTNLDADVESSQDEALEAEMRLPDKPPSFG